MIQWPKHNGHIEFIILEHMKIDSTGFNYPYILASVFELADVGTQIFDSCDIIALFMQGNRILSGTGSDIDYSIARQKIFMKILHGSLIFDYAVAMSQSLVFVEGIVELR